MKNIAKATVLATTAMMAAPAIGTAQYTGCYHPPPSDSIRYAYRVKGSEKKENRHTEREYCDTDRIVNQHLSLPMAKNKCLITDE
ncbi:hypothetical protein ACLX1H_004906 [Fusarium chlamydosporum]